MKIDRDAHVQARQAQAPNEGMQYTTFHSHPKVLKNKTKFILVMKLLRDQEKSEFK